MQITLMNYFIITQQVKLERTKTMTETKLTETLNKLQELGLDEVDLMDLGYYLLYLQNEV